jgi:hypothetical protein
LSGRKVPQKRKTRVPDYLLASGLMNPIDTTFALLGSQTHAGCACTTTGETEPGAEKVIHVTDFTRIGKWGQEGLAEA